MARIAPRPRESRSKQTERCVNVPARPAVWGAAAGGRDGGLAVVNAARAHGAQVDIVETPLISVVIPAHNRSRTISYCLESVIRQTYAHLDIVVVDDGSTDDTMKIVAAVPDARVRGITQSPARGAQAARNRGIREARGPWIAFLDSDDEWLPDKVERQVAILAENNGDEHLLVHGDCIKYYPGIGRREVFHLPVTAGGDVYGLLLTRQAPLFQCMLVSKRALEEIGYLDEDVPSYQEWDTAVRLAKVCRFVHVQEPLFVYHLHEGETISKDRTRDFLGYQYVLQKHQRDIIRLCGVETWKSHLLLQYRRFFELGVYAQDWRRNDRIVDALDAIFRDCHDELGLQMFDSSALPISTILSNKVRRTLRRVRRWVSAKP